MGGDVTPCVLHELITIHVYMFLTTVTYLQFSALRVGILILTIVMFPIIVIWLNTETILLVLQQCPDVARSAMYTLSVLFAVGTLAVE